MTKLLFAGLVAVLLAVCAPCASAGVFAPAFYVSPTGSDANSGLSPAAPFQTLERARSAMRGSVVKTTYLLGGTYPRSAALSLNGADAGESWLGFPGQTPVLDGQGTTAEAFFNYKANNTTFRWLTIQNFTHDGVLVQGSTGVTIDSNTISNILATAWSEGAIQTDNTFTNGKITHNYIHDVQADGINVTTAVGDDISNVLIDSNNIQNTCTFVDDCGAIHLNDRNQSSTHISITNNVVKNGGPNTMGRFRTIYLDDYLSNAAIKNNIVYGAQQMAFIMHGGSNNTFSNNIFDISASYKLGYSQGEGTSVMTGNTFSCNIVYSSSTPPAALWIHVAPGAKPAAGPNLYFDTVGTLPNASPVIDRAPTVADPGFVNAPAGNYNFSRGAPFIAGCTFAPISTANVGPLTNPLSSGVGSEAVGRSHRRPV